jgi:hypothetical protein
MHQPPPAVGRGVGDCAWSSTPPSATATYYGDSNAPTDFGWKTGLFQQKIRRSLILDNSHAFMGSLGVMCVNCMTPSSSLHDRLSSKVI